MKRIAIAPLTAAALTVALIGTGCSSNPTEPGTSSGSAAPAQSQNQSLHDALPAGVKQAGKLISVNGGAFPPYEIPTGNTHRLDGASADLAVALGQVLGVKVENVSAPGLPAELSGIAAHRYDFALGPIGDFADREGDHDFVDWVKEYVVFAVPKGNPKHINSLADTCGLKIAVMAGGSAEQVIKSQSTTCTKQGKPAVKVQSYQDQSASILSVRSHRADGFFSSEAPLTYYVKQSHGQLDLAGTDSPNGFHDLYQGAVVPKDSPLTDVLQKALQALFQNGTYNKIMQKWGITANQIKQPGVNLGKNTTS
jgi:polar amino acid transport system substrate-binding protein